MQEAPRGEGGVDPNTYEESDFLYEDVEYVFSGQSGSVKIEDLLNKNDQMATFKFKLYNYLYEHDYKKIRQAVIQNGEWQEEDNVKFAIVVITDDGTELNVCAEYDVSLYSIFFHFVSEELSAKPVEITKIDAALYDYLKDDLEKIEKVLGEYLFKQKNLASAAEVTSYEKEGDKIVIQLLLNDEYLMYCKIYYDLYTGDIECKLGGH